MRAFSIFVGVALGFLALWVAATVGVEYMKAKDLTGWERWRATAQNSATVLWGKFTILIAGLTANLDQFFDAVGLPQVSTAINQFVTPKTMAVFMAAIAVGSIAFRRRTL